MYLKDFESKNKILEINEKDRINFQFTYFNTILSTAKTDLAYLTNINKHLLNDFGQVPIIRELIFNSNIDFLNSKTYYSCLRLFDSSGNAIVELKKGKTGTYIINSNTGPLRGDEYYFVHSLLLDKEEIFITPFELYLESGGSFNSSEIRFSMPLFDDLGNRIGVLVLTMDKDIFMRNYIKGFVDKNSYIYILSILNPDSLDVNKSTINYSFDNVTTKLFKMKFPSIIPYLKNINTDEGQFYNSYGLFTFKTF